MSRSDIAAAMLTRHVTTAIDDAMCFKADTTCDEAAKALARCDFDNAPVKDADGVIGHVNQFDAEQCSESLRRCMRPLQNATVVGVDTPLSDLLGRLKDHDFLHVIGGHGVVGLVTPSDFNKQAGRAYFYLSVSDFEIRLASCVRRGMSDEKALAKLSSKRRRSVRKRIEQQREEDLVADAIAAMDITDLLKIATVTGLLSGLQEPLRHSDGTLEEELVALRNDVMHLVRKMAHDQQSSVLRLCELDQQLQRLLDEVEVATFGELSPAI